MSHFTGRLQLDFGDWGNAGRIAILLDDVTWRCDTPGAELTVTIPVGTMSDGASVPQFLWWFMPPWGDRSTFAAIAHDFLMDAVLDGHPVVGAEKRSLCDRQFYLALRCLGVPLWRARLAWLGVRANSILYETFGWPPQRSDQTTPLMEKQA